MPSVFATVSKWHLLGGEWEPIPDVFHAFREPDPSAGDAEERLRVLDYIPDRMPDTVMIDGKKYWITPPPQIRIPAYVAKIIAFPSAKTELKRKCWKFAIEESSRHPHLVEALQTWLNSLNQPRGRYAHRRRKSTYSEEGILNGTATI